MGNKLKKRKIMPDLILSSPAKRAKKTAIAVAKALGYPKKEIMFFDKMYHARARHLFDLLKSLDDENETIMLFGHNPSFNDFADMLLRRNPIHNIPTTGVCCIKFDVNQWQKVKEGKGEIVFIDFPKRYKDESV
jgi:phosphohistidine phosphatase